MLKVNILTIFPDMFPGPLATSLSGVALRSGLWSLDVTDIRSFSEDKHQSVDDRPYGGGAGMVLRADVIGRAVDSVLVNSPDTKFFYMTPSGKQFNQDIAGQIAKLSNITLLCGRFEGVDKRVIDFYPFEELSIGDYILSGGELASMVLLDTCIRLLPEVISNKLSVMDESFSELNNMLECPPYTRPYEWRGLVVPEVLRSGNHLKIRNWKNMKMLELTKEKRPDLVSCRDKVE